MTSLVYWPHAQGALPVRAGTVANPAMRGIRKYRRDVLHRAAGTGASPRRGDLGHTAAMTVPTGNVTFLLTDIEGSTRNWETSESDMRAALARHDELLARHIREHGGAVLTERGEGDSFFAVFPTASGAVAAGLAIQQAIGREPWPERVPINVRVALHTGEAGQDHRGPDVNRCARLRALAHGGQVLISATTAALVRGGLPDGASLQDLG